MVIEDNWWRCWVVDDEAAVLGFFSSDEQPVNGRGVLIMREAATPNSPVAATDDDASQRSLQDSSVSRLTQTNLKPAPFRRPSPSPFALLFVSPTNPEIKPKTNRRSKWYMDSRASGHMTGEVEEFVSLDEHSGLITFADDSKGKILDIAKVGGEIGFIK